jgi:hypothetical protein
MRSPPPETEMKIPFLIIALVVAMLIALGLIFFVLLP